MREFWNGLDWSALAELLASVLPALLCITLHELAHGYAAYRLGDDTAKRAGRLTLNPVRHIDWLGLAMMVAFRFGWAKPVPVDMRKFAKPKTGMAITAAAGPLCNLVLGALLLFLFGLLYAPLTRSGSAAGGWVLQMIGSGAYLSLALAVFNILPIPPLDGSKVLLSLLDDQKYRFVLRYERFGMLLLLALVWSGLLRTPLSAATGWLYDLLYPLVNAGYALTGGTL